MTDQAGTTPATDSPAAVLDAAAAAVAQTGAQPTPATAENAAPAGPPVQSAADNAAGRIGVLLGIDLPVVVRFGRTELPIRALAKLGPGSVIELGRAPGDPVDMLVGERIVARGEVVIVGGNYGIRIVEVMSNPFRERRGVRNAGIGQPTPPGR
jgi:flagellar motor switch protein FliN/FliY